MIVMACCYAPASFLPGVVKRRCSWHIDRVMAPEAWISGISPISIAASCNHYSCGCVVHFVLIYTDHTKCIWID